MPPSHPPAGSQKQYNERPLKVFGEQMVAGQPLPIGAVLIPDLYADGLPRVFTDTQAFILHETEWVISNRYSGRPIEVLSDDEFSERFGGGNTAEET